jgi:hypothetical protein
LGIRFWRFNVLLAAMLGAGGAHCASQAEFDKAMGYDGLQRVQVKGLSLAYKRPDATLAAYKRVRIDPVDVRFHKSWKPMETGSRIPLSAAAREDIRTGLAEVVQEQFAKALTAAGSYAVVNESGPDVLRVGIHVVDLYVNAPESASSSPSNTFAMSAGEMTLFLELFDSESGQILARVVDRRQGRSSNLLAMAGQVSNVAEAENIAAAWARIMRDALDRAHGAPQQRK